MSYRPQRPGISWFHSSLMIPILKISGCVALAGGLIAVLFLWAIPFVKTLVSPPVTEAIVPNQYSEPSVAAQTDVKNYGDLSTFQREAVIKYKSISDAYFWGDEILFATTTVRGGISVYDKLVLYNTEAQTSEELSGIELKYDNIVNCLMNEDYIAFLDSSSNGGGRVMGYDRKTKTAFAIKDYVYGAPLLCMDGNMIAFMQQAGDDLDRLYVYDLSTRESVCVGSYTGHVAPPSSADLCNGILVYAIHNNNNGNITSTIMLRKLDGSEPVKLDAQRYVCSPVTDGTYVAFTTTNRGPRSDLYLMKEGKTPVMIADDVLNFEMGDGFVAFTKDENVFAYQISTGKTFALNTEVSLGFLSSVCGSRVCWYDVTGGYAQLDIIKYAELIWG